jgi:molybdopterin molybdotransferase
VAAKDFFRVVSLKQASDAACSFEAVGVERVPLGDALGRRLGEDVAAELDVPGFDRATMDGYAVAASSTFGASEANPALLRLVGSVDMGQGTELRLGPGDAARIATGGMLPAGADAVVMVEHTEEIDGESLEASRSVAPGQHVLGRGEDVRQGEIVLPRGARLRPQELGLLAALGRTELSVHRRPLVAIISTGDEVVPIEREPGPGQIRDVNSTTLAAMVEQAGAVARPLGLVPDDPAALGRASRGALAEADAVLLSGGSSVGARDYTLEVIAALPEAQLLLHGVGIKPGKPTLLARVGRKPFWGLPGQVTSAMVVFRLLVRPCLERLGGAVAPEVRARAQARISRNVASVHGRADFVRVRLREEAGTLWADPILGPSGLVRTMTEADGLVEIGTDVEGLDAGTAVWVTPL